MNGVGRTACIEDGRAAALFGVALLALVLWPVRQNWRATKTDSFPLSYYPMFSARRRRRMRVTHLVGYDGAGGVHVLPYLYAGSGGLNQVRKQIARTVERGDAAELCRKVAAYPPRAGDLPLVSVAVVTSEYRVSRFFAGAREPASVVVHATAAVAA
jgi:hypothetical protein